MGLEQGIALIGWLEQGSLKFRIGCPKHMVQAVRPISAVGVQLVCQQCGCPLGQWNDEASFESYIKDLCEKLRVAYLEPPLVRPAA
jgi:hypothetical protein